MLRWISASSFLVLVACTPDPTGSGIPAPSTFGSSSDSASGGPSVTSTESSGSSSTSGSSTSTTSSASTGGSASDTTAGSDGTTTGTPTCRPVYVALDGLTLIGGYDDATNNISAIVSGDMLPYPADPVVFMTQLEDALAPFNVCVTEERPGSGTYDMVVFTDENMFGAGVYGVSALDCMDENPSNVVVVLTDDESVSDTFLAHVAAGRLAVSWGLHNQNHEPGDLLYSAGTFEDPQWIAQCIEHTATEACETADDCPAGQQNSRAHLLDLLGPA